MDTLKLNTSTGNYLIDTNSIVRVEASSNYSKIFFSNGKMLITANLLSWFEEKLEPGNFTRLHRNHLINNHYLLLRQPAGKSPELQNGKNIPISRKRKKMVLQKLAAASILFILFSFAAIAQNVGVGTNTPHASAALDVVSSNKGMSIPSLTTAQRTAITNPKAGLFVFDTNLQTLCMFNGANWVYFQSSVETNEVLPVEQVASDGEVGDEFGHSVAISGNYAIVGAPYDNTGVNNDQGSAYIFFFNGTTWIEQAKLVAAGGAANDNFGLSVSISGDYAIVGAPYNNLGAFGDVGRAYVYIRNGTTWTQQANFTGASAFTGDNFGYSVSINGAYAAIGAKEDDVGANTNEGSVYFFARSGVSWTQQDQVVAPLGDANDQFGYSVSISGDYAVVGAPYDDIAPGIDNGTIHIFLRSGTNWDHQQTYFMPLFNDGYNLGYKVSISGDMIVAGIPQLNTSPGGGVRFLRRNGALWESYDGVSSILSTEVNPDRLGRDGLATFGNYTIIGSASANFQGVLKGVAYLYQTPTPVGSGFWYFVRKIADPLGQFAYHAGYSAAVSDSYAIIGAPNSNGSKGKVLFLKL